MKDQFYITLPSNSSMHLFPENTTACYTTQLSQRLYLPGEWEVGLVEFHYPQTLKNVYGDNNLVYMGGQGHFVQKFKIAGGFTSPARIVRSINDIPEVNKFTKLEIDSKGYVTLTRSNHVDEAISNIRLHPHLAFQLGFDSNANLLTLKRAARPCDVSLGMSNQIYVYCNIVESQIVGDTMAPLLRIVHINKVNYVHGSYMTASFESPHYLPLSRQEFETIVIDLRDDTGTTTPFLFGTSCAKLHFRKCLTNTL